MRRVLLAVLLTTLPSTAFAQLDMNNLGQATTVDFAGFTGVGIGPTPAAGQLDSNIWRFTGFSDGDTAFGDALRDTGDFARGASNGGVSTGGIYAFQVPNGSGVSTALGVQPGGSDFTPGTATLRARNNTGSLVTSIAFSMRYCFLNDQDRSSTLTIDYSLDDTTYLQVGSITPATTPETATTGATWQCQTVAGTISGLSLANGALVYFRLSGDDAAGTGGRDEVAVDEISLTPTGSAPPVDLGVPDTGTPDLGVPDTGTPDTGTVTPDTGTVTPDTGTVTPDTGTVTPDTGTVTPDMGTSDTIASDGSVTNDTGSTKDSGGSKADSGTKKPGDDGGCDCRTGGNVEATPTLAWLGLLLVLVLQRKRRKR